MLRTIIIAFILFRFTYTLCAASVYDPGIIYPLTFRESAPTLPTFPQLLNGSLSSYNSYRTLIKTTVFPPSAEAILLPPPVDGEDPLHDQTNTMQSLYQEQTTPLRSLFNGLKDRLVNSITTDALLQLPVGVRSEIAGKGYTVGILKADFTPEGATLTIMVEVETADTSRRLYFGANGIPFSGSNGLSGGVQIGLIGDYPLQIGASQAVMILKGTNPLIPNDQGGTFVRVDCDGFKGMHLGADMLFNGNNIIPVDAQGNDMSGRLESHLEIDAASLDDIYVGISLNPFRIKGVPDFYFEVADVQVDFSDYVSPEIKTLPAGYQSPFLLPGSRMDPAWRGVSIGRLAVHSLPGLTHSEGGHSKEIAASQVLIDDQGFTGEVSITNLIPLDEGNLDGWAFSIDSLQIGMIANQLVKFGFAGLVHVPIFKGETADSSRTGRKDCFAYRAIVTAEENYQFSVATLGDMDIPMWKANCHLASNSALLIERFASQFYAEATLHGDFSLRGDEESNPSEGGVAFQNLTVRNVRPYIEVGSIQCGLHKGFSIAGFSVVMDTLGVKPAGGDRIGLIIGCGISLTSEKDGDEQGLGASGSFTLFGKLEEVAERQVWVGDGMKVNDICLNLELKKFTLAGCLSYYEDDPLFGHGFYGVVNAQLNLEMGQSPGFAAVAQFGKMADYKYYLVDVLVKLGKGIPLGVLELQGLGGGLSHHMQREELDSTAVAFHANTPEKVTIGQSISGIVYHPNKGAGIIFRLNTLLALTATPKLVNGIVALSFAFNGQGGIKNISLDGAGGMLTEPKNTVQEYQHTLANAHLKLLFDFENRSFTGELGVHIQTDGLIASGNVHCDFSPDNWYIWIGEPQHPIQAVLLGIGASAYFDVGSKLPPPAALPANVARLTKATDFSQSLPMLSNGKGMAFGFAIGSAGDTTHVGPILVLLAAQLGADMLMREISGVSCAGREGPVGINNWYALGQVYAFLAGTIAYDGKLFRKQVSFTIAQLAAAILLQGRAPNPTYFQGILAGKYNLLNGLVKGSFRAKLSIGDDCELNSNAHDQEQLDLIVAIDPDPSAASDVRTDINPTVEFIFPVGQTFVLPDVDGENNYYRFEIAKVQLSDDRGPISGVVPYPGGNTSLSFQPQSLLDPFTQYHFSVSLRVMERVNGKWQPIEESGTEMLVDTTISFVTGAGDSVLMLSNLAAAYPVQDQQNFHSAEFTTGYFKLEKWQPNVLDGQDLEVYLTQPGQEWHLPLNQDASTKTLSFALPELMPEKTTHLILQSVQSGKTLLAYDFRTSKYPTFKAKMAATQVSTSTKANAAFAVDNYAVDEPIDEVDASILWHISVSTGFPWYLQYAQPLLYDHYPNTDFDYIHQDPHIGFPPTQAVRLQYNPGSTNFSITNAFFQMVEQDYIVFKTLVLDYLAEYLRGIDETDAMDQNGQVTKSVIDQLSDLLPPDKQYILELYQASYRKPPSAIVEYRIDYTLPGGGYRGTTVTSSYQNQKNTQ